MCFLRRSRMNMRMLLFGATLFALAACTPVVKEDEQLVESLMKTNRAFFQKYLDHRDDWEVQIIYTEINRDSANRPMFKSFYFNFDSTRYFYPASTVKLPQVVLALQKLNQLGKPGVNLFTTMVSDSVYSGQLSVMRDTTSHNGWPSIAHYAKKILIVSDNDAFNRLYEFVGQGETNRALRSRGYQARFLHRLERPLTPDQNRHTEAIRFLDERACVIYQQPMLVNDSIVVTTPVLRGVGYMRDDSLVAEPFNFTYKNFYPLHEQQRVLRSILFPETVPPGQQFELTQADRDFLLQYLSQYPAETNYPHYFRDTTYYDAYCKFLMFGEDRARIPERLRIFNKVGDAYGYLIDNAYIVDFENGVEFMLSAVINTNTDGIFNDGKYEYITLGFPFMKELGLVVYDHERKRARPRRPDLSKFKLSYDRAR
jgi:hypothetical protein